MVFEAHCMSFPCTEILLFNYAKVKTVFHSMAPLTSCEKLNFGKKQIRHSDVFEFKLLLLTKI